MRLESFDGDASVFFGHDAKLDALLALELAVDDEAGGEVELVENDVVTFLPVDRVDDDVLAVARCVEKPDLLFIDPEETAESCAGVGSCFAATAAILLQHLVVGIADDRVPGGF